MILISRTYETWTPDDIEAGDTDSRGFEFTDEPVTFRELVDMIGREGFFRPSCSPATGSTFEWLETEPDIDYRTGEQTTFSLHFSRNNKPAAAKYWRAAFQAHNLTRN
jgi:hypothetical protein